MVVHAAVAALAVAIMLSSPAAAQNSRTAWERQVRYQLQQASTALNLGYELQPSHNVFIDALNNNTYEDVRYDLRAGDSYLFLGVCDNDCSGLQLRLYDNNGNLIDSDTTRGGYPVLTAQVYRTGTFYLRVTMRGCYASPCWAGVEAYH
jgi:hypothetical protein